MAEQPSDIEIDAMTEMIEQPSDNQTSETKMAEQSSDNEIGEATGMIGPPSDDQIEKILTEARFQFALKSLEAVMRLKKNKNIVFSPHSIYEGLLLVYLASSDDTELHLRRKLGLPDHIPLENIKNWISNNIIEKRKEKNKYAALDETTLLVHFQHKFIPDYNHENLCWITNTKCVNNSTQYLLHDELEVMDFYHNSGNLKNRINELLKNKTKDYIPTSVKLNNINENMEIILSNILCLKCDTVQNIPTDENEMYSPKEARTVVSPKLKVIVTELPFKNKNLSLFLLFPAVKFVNYAEWLVDGKISELVERLTTKEGIDELRRVLDDQESSTEKWNADEVLYSDFFNLENELETDKLLDELGIQNLLEPDKATLSNFTDEKLHIGGALHRAFIKVTRDNVIASAVNIFFTKEGVSFNPITGINHFKCAKKFIWLLYCRKSHTILFIGSVNEEKLFPMVQRKYLF